MIEQNQTDQVLRQNKLLGLEIIRFISALSVLIWHYQHFFYVADKPVDFVRERQPFYSVLGIFYDYGFYGVQVFWCISGFIFFWKYREAIASRAVSYKKFFVLRFSRLYPLHFVTLLLVLVLQAVYFAKNEYFFVYQNNDISHFIYQIFLASNWGFEKGFSFNGPIWSISVEVVAYCFFFVALRNVGKSFFVNVAVLLLCLVAGHFKIESKIFDCLSFFYLGGLSAIAFCYVRTKIYHGRVFYLCLFALFALPAFACVANLRHGKYFDLLFLMLYTPILLFCGAHCFNVPPAIQKVIEAAGNVTYSSYLIHFPVQLFVALCFLGVGQKIPYYSDVFFVGFVFVTLALSCCIYRLFEVPAQNYIRKKLA